MGALFSTLDILIGRPLELWTPALHVVLQPLHDHHVLHPVLQPLHDHHALHPVDRTAQHLRASGIFIK